MENEPINRSRKLQLDDITGSRNMLKRRVSRNPKGPDEYSYEDMLTEWKEKISMISFIFDYVLEKYQKKLNRYSLTLFFLSSITTLFSLGNLGISYDSHPSVYWTIQSLNLSAALVTNFCAAKIKIMGWQAIVTNSQKYLDLVEHFLAEVTSETILPPEYRTDPEKFIIDKKDKFLAILSSAPDINNSDYLEGLEAYKKSKERFRNDLLIL